MNELDYKARTKVRHESEHKLRIRKNDDMIACPNAEFFNTIHPEAVGQIT